MRLLSVLTLLLAPLFCSAQIPTLNFVKEFNHNGVFEFRKMEVDKSGNIYVAGEFNGTIDMDPNGGVSNISTGIEDAFIAKYSSTGTLLWHYKLNSPYADFLELKVDYAGNLYAAGTFINTSYFDGSTMTSVVGNMDAFLLKLSPAGVFMKVVTWGSNNNDLLDALEFRPNNEVLLGLNLGGNTDVDPGAAVVTSNWANILCLSEAGNYIWHHSLSINTGIYDIAYHPYDSSFFVGGSFLNYFNPDPDNPTTLFTTTGIGHFINKYTNDYQLEYIRYGSTPGGVIPYNNIIELEIDQYENIYSIMRFKGTNNLNAGGAALNVVSSGSLNDLALVKFRKDGTVHWSRTYPLNTDFFNFAPHIELDPLNRLYLGSWAAPVMDLDPSGSTANTLTNSFFLCAYDSLGNYYYHHNQGSNAGYGNFFRHHNNGRFYLCGNSTSFGDLNLGAGTYNVTPTFLSVDYISVYNNCLTPPNPVISTSMSELNVCLGSSSTLTAYVYGNASWYTAPSSGAFLGSGVSYTTPPLTSNTTYYVRDTLCNASPGFTAVTVNIVSAVTSTNNQTICDGGVYSINGNDYSVAGTYIDTLLSSTGCDSIVTTNLAVNSVNTSVFAATDSIASSVSGMTYQWYDCDLSAIIPGETQQFYLPSSSGNYAVIVNDGTCVDTSVCTFVSLTTIVSCRENDFRFYPNPFSTSITLYAKNNTTVNMYNLTGEMINTYYVTQGSNSIDLSELPKGVYYLKNGSKVERLIKQ